MNPSTPALTFLAVLLCGCAVPAPSPQRNAVSAAQGCPEKALLQAPAMPRSLWDPMDGAPAAAMSFPWEQAASPVVVGAPLPTQPHREPVASAIPNAGARPEYLIDTRPVPTEVRDSVDP